MYKYYQIVRKPEILRSCKTLIYNVYVQNNPVENSRTTSTLD